MALPSSIIKRGTRAAQPAATAVAAGTLYAVTDEDNLLERSNGTSWETSESASAVGINNSLVNGRLTTETGVPVSTSDRTSQSTIYFTPYNGNQIALYDGSSWQMKSFTELSLALSGLTSGKNYDVFVDYNGGTPQLVLSASWTNDTTRADAITLQDGVYVKSGATDHRLIGTIRTTSTTTTEDSAAKAFVWNLYNAEVRPVRAATPTNWSTTVASFREFNNSSAYRIEAVIGIAGTTVDLKATIYAGNTNGYTVGIGQDSATVSHANCYHAIWGMGGSYMNNTSTLAVQPTAGYHYWTGLERRTALTTDCYANPSGENVGGLRGQFAR
jgi:hypothetical protein